MRRLLPLLLAALFTPVAQPAMANQVVVRGSVSHHHHFFFVHRHDRGFATVNPFLFPNNAGFTLTTPFVAASPFFLSANPFFFDGGIFPTSSFGPMSSFGAFAGGFGAPVALGGGGDFADGGAGAQPRIIVVAAPVAAPPSRRAEDERATVEVTPSGVTIIRGRGTGR